MGNAPRSLSVGKLEFTPVPLEDRKWGVIGCAPGRDPHWLLFHYGRAAARLVLLFDDDAHAKSYVGKWIDSTHLQGNLPPVRRFVTRQVQDLNVAPGLSVASVAATPQLLDWMHDVVLDRLSDLPQEFADTAYDVVFLPSPTGSAGDVDAEIARDDPFRAGRLALLRDSLCGTGIRYENPRPLRL